MLTTFFVDDSFAGVDIGAHEYTSVQGAIDAAQDGDSIVINAGHYNENIRIFKSLNISGATGSAADVVIGSNTGSTITVSEVALAMSDISVTSGDGIGIYVHSVDGGSGSVDLDNVVVASARDGIFINANNAVTYNVSLNDVRIDGAGKDALEVLARNGAEVNVIATGLSATNAGMDAVRVTANSDANVSIDLIDSNLDGANENAFHILATKATVNGTTSHTSMNDAGRNGFVAVLDDHADGGMRFEYSPSNNAGGNALRVEAVNGAYYDIDVIDGSMLGSGSDSVFIRQDTGSVIDLFIDPTPRDRGYKFLGDNGTALSAHVLDTPLSSVAEPANFGVYGELFNGASMNLIVENSAIDSALLDGVYVKAVGSVVKQAEFNVTFKNSSITNSGRRGLALDLDNAIATLNFDNSIVSGSAANNIFLLGVNNSSATFNFGVTSGDLSGSGSDGIFTSLDNSTGQFTFAGLANFDGNLRHGMLLGVKNGGNVSVVANNGLSIDGVGNTGIVINADGGTATVTGNQVSIDNAGVDGILVIGKNSGVAGVNLTNANSIFNAGDNAIHYNLASNAVGDVRISPPALSTLNMDSSGNDGIFGNVTGGATAILQLSDFTLNDGGGHGINFNLDQGNLAGSSLTNGQILGNGSLASTTSGIRINAVNGAQVGTRSSKSAGITLINMMVGNNLLDPPFQDFGIEALVDGNSYVGVRVENSEISQNGQDGVNGLVNGDLSSMDTSLLCLTMVGTDVINNQGDGFHLRANNGTGTLATQSSGIVLNFDTGDITNNGNAMPGDGIGDGIDAFAQGDGMFAGNTIITLNLVDFDLSGNDEDSFRINQPDGGVVRRDLTGGTVDSLALCAVGPLDVQVLNLNGTIVNTGLFMCAELGGTVQAAIQNINFTNTVGPGVTFRAKTGGTINASLTNVNVQNAGPNVDVNTNLGGTGAVIGLVENAMSTVTFDMDNVAITGSTTSGMSGFDVDVIDGGTFSSVIKNTTVEGNNPDFGKGEFDVFIDGANSSATFDIDGLNVNNSLKRGIQFIGTGGATLDIPRFDRVFANDAVGFGLNIDLASSTLTQFHSSVARFNNAGTTGANIKVSNSMTPADIQLFGFWAEDAGNIGIDIGLTNVTGGINKIRATSVRAQRAVNTGFKINNTTLGATDTLEVTIDGNSRVGFSGSNALDIQAGGALGSVATIGIDGLNATGAKKTGVNIGLQGSIVGDIVALNNITMLGTKNFGVGVLANGAAALRTLNSTNVNANGAAWAGMKIDLDAQAIPTSINISNYTADDNGRRGFDITLNGAFGGTSNINLDNVSALRTQLNNGALIKASNMGATDTINVSLTNSNFSQDVGNSLIADNTPTASPRRRGKNAVAFQFDGAAGSQVNIDANNITADFSGATGISAFFGGSVQASVPTFNNISATDAFGAGAIFSVGTSATLTDVSSAFVDVSNAINGAGLIARVDSQAVGTALSFDNLVATNAGRIGVDVTLIDVHGASTVNLSNVVATGAKAGEGLNFDDRGMAPGDTLALNIMSADFSSSFLDAVNINLEGVAASTATASIAVDGLTAQNAGNDGIDLNIDNGVAAEVTQFDNVAAQSNLENGLKVKVQNGASLVDFVASNLNLSNNATSGVGFDGIDVQVSNASSAATFNFTNLTVNNSGGRGIDLDVFDQGSLTFNVNGGSVNTSGLGGLDLNVGSSDEFGLPVVFTPSATFNASFKDLDVSNNGQSLVFARDGVNLDVRGAGVVANVAFDHVTANNNDDDGFDIFTNTGATTTIQLDNASSGNNNGTTGGGGGVTGRGFKFIADGATTTASLSSASGALGNNVFDSNINGPGFEAILTNGVMSNDLTINASASGNAGDGVRIIANDGTGVTVANFGVSGTGLQVNNNIGNGLFVDFFLVGGVNGFDLSNATVSGNNGDQVFTRFRSMTLNDYFLQDVTLTGKAGSGDGIEVQLIDTTITNISTPGVANGFVVSNVHSSSNGGFGLNLSVEEADAFGAGDGIITAGIAGGLIRLSEFDNNGLAGARLQFGGDSLNDFEIFNNTAGFHNNSGEGLLIEIQDRSFFSLTGNNVFNPDPLAKSFYNNMVTGNQGVGVRFVASEPNDPDLINADGLGPSYTLELGDILRNPNTITGNRDAAMSLEGRGDSTGSFTIVNSILNNTTNGALAGLNGDGLNVNITDFASLSALTVDGTAAGLDVSGNTGSGIVTQVSRSGRLGTATRATILNTTITGNGLHGIDVQRRDNGLYADTAANHAIIIGSHGNGNDLRNNTNNGINIVNENKPGLPVVFDLDITDNTLTNNLNGVFLRGTGNAQFSGNMSDNSFDAHRQDGVQVVLENDAALGNPNGVAIPPFVMDGNQINNSIRHGVFFDTNFTNENGLFGGGAFVNVDIRSSDFYTDAFGARVRTSISNNGQNGLQIIDNSDFTSAASPVTQNTYRVKGADIVGNVDGIFLEQGERTAPGGPSGGATRDLNNGVHLIVGDSATTFLGNRDVVLQGNDDDGIDLEVRDGDTQTNRFTIDRTTILGNGANGDNQRNEMGPQNVGHGIEAEITSAGRLFSTYNDVDVIQNFGDGIDYTLTTTLNGVVGNTIMFAVQSSQNGGRGLDVNLEHDRSLAAPSTSNWFIGSAAQVNNAAETNRFNENAREGVVFNVEATRMDQDTVRVPPLNDAQFDQQNRNDDVFVEGNLPRQAGSFSPRDFISTTHTGLGPLGVGNTTIGTGDFMHTPADILAFGGTNVHFVANINFINTEIANNGGYAGFEDGLDIAVGYLTRVNSYIGNVSFGGNVGDDLRVYPQQSNEVLPPLSQRDGRNNAGAPGDGFLVYDPVAYIDLVLGMVDVNGDGTPDTVAGNGRAANSGTGGTGNGDQITIYSVGTTQTTQITNTGVITTADPMKRNTRPVYLAGRVYDTGTFNNTAVNDFFQNGTQQNIATQFFFFEQFAGVMVPPQVSY
ncbi:MAG: hypothetical protein R3C18_01445 [Planctomycetaceae bacterium]